MVTKLNPKYFLKYNVNKSYFDGKIILYRDRRPTGKLVEYADIKYRLGSSETFKISGSVSNPKRAIYKITNSYDSHLVLSSEDSQGYLFVYDGFEISTQSTSGAADAPKQIKFILYPLLRQED